MAQSNFEVPGVQRAGNLDTIDSHGHIRAHGLSALWADRYRA